MYKLYTPLYQESAVGRVQCIYISLCRLQILSNKDKKSSQLTRRHTTSSTGCVIMAVI